MIRRDPATDTVELQSRQAGVLADAIQPESSHTEFIGGVSYLGDEGARPEITSG